jgi:hypothetical protein
MFEIIMLFAFLYAATCQMFPERPAPKRSPLSNKSLSSKKENGSLRKPTQKHRAAQKLSVKSKSRNHNYAHAA